MTSISAGSPRNSAADIWPANTPTSTPREPAQRGGHVAVHHPDARRLVTELAEHLVIPDFRDPDIVRIGCSPLTTRFTDVFDGLTRLADLT